MCKPRPVPYGRLGREERLEDLGQHASSIDPLSHTGPRRSRLRPVGAGDRCGVRPVGHRIAWQQVEPHVLNWSMIGDRHESCARSTANRRYRVGCPRTSDSVLVIVVHVQRLQRLICRRLRPCPAGGADLMGALARPESLPAPRSLPGPATCPAAASPASPRMVVSGLLIWCATAAANSPIADRRTIYQLALGSASPPG